MSDKPSALSVVEDQKKMEVAKRFEVFAEMQSFDWKALPPHLMAQVLTKKPYKGKSGEPDYYLSPEQALIFAMRAYELNLSPLSGEVWFNRDTWTTNVTLEGKLRKAKEANLNPVPQFSDLKRPWKTGATKLAGYAEEPGIKCSIKIGDEVCAYDVWLSEWYVSYSPLWKSKPEHMMRIRAFDKVLAFASGVGVSEMPDEREIQTEEAAAQSASPVPTVTAKRVEFKPQGMPKTQSYDKQELPNDPDLVPILKASVTAAEEKKNK